MNWIILLLAGLFEVSLTFCLGKTRTASGFEFYLWGGGFLVSTIIKHGTACQGRTNVAVRHSLCHLDRYRGGRYGPDRHFCL